MPVAMPLWNINICDRMFVCGAANPCPSLMAATRVVATICISGNDGLFKLKGREGVVSTDMPYAQTGESSNVQVGVPATLAEAEESI